jgi:cell division protein FtsB
MSGGKKEMLIRVFWRRIGILVLLLVLAAMVLAVWKAYGKERESGTLRSQAEQQLAELLAQEENLNARISKLQTDRGKEEALRAQSEWGRSGEGLIVIVEPDEPEPIEATSTMRQWVQKFLPFW